MIYKLEGGESRVGRGGEAQKASIESSFNTDSITFRN